jgi:hypothetical protein
MTRLTPVVVLLATVALSALPFPAEAQAPPRRLQLSFESDGTVTLHAASVSVREVLMEWARQCGCAIVNAPNVPGTLDVPVEFDHARQDVVLASLLRRAAGFVLTPRRAGMTGPSQFETVYVLPTSNASASAAYVPPPPAFTPVPPPTAGSPADEIPPVTPIPTLPPQTGPSAGQPQAPAAAPQQPARIGVPTRFVPIVPIGGSTPAATPPGAPGSGAPGTLPQARPQSSAPGTSTPVVPSPPGAQVSPIVSSP